MLAKDKATQTKRAIGRGIEHMQRYDKGRAGQQTACKRDGKQKEGVATDQT